MIEHYTYRVRRSAEDNVSLNHLATRRPARA